MDLFVWAAFVGGLVGVAIAFALKGVLVAQIAVGALVFVVVAWLLLVFVDEYRKARKLGMNRFDSVFQVVVLNRW